MINSGRDFMNIYEHCPVYSNDMFRLELVSAEHCSDLLKVYSDISAVPLFNSDNCGGDNFYYTSYERMKEAIDYWLWEYSRKGFIRLAVVDIEKSVAVGTVEMFRRIADDYFSDTVLLRIDLRSDYEKSQIIASLLQLLLDNCFDMFDCCSVTTKAISIAQERIRALCDMNFRHSDEKLIGHDGTEYADYYIFVK